MTSTEMPELLTVAQAAEIMGITTRSVHNRIHSGQIQALTPSPRITLIPRAEAEKFRGAGPLKSGPKPGNGRGGRPRKALPATKPEEAPVNDSSRVEH